MTDYLRISSHKSEGVYVGSFQSKPAAWTLVTSSNRKVCETGLEDPVDSCLDFGPNVAF
jgi:hypothetical protein